MAFSPRAYHEVLELQRLLMAQARDPKMSARTLSLVACAWERLEERKRIMRMRPKPKDVDVGTGRKVKPPKAFEPEEVPVAQSGIPDRGTGDEAKSQ